jgi:glutathione peroxidase-family protein
MISKEYTLSHDKYDRKALEIMRSWCNQYVGKAADSREQHDDY